ncbi:MAG: cytidylate kinase family protein [Clostridia bacterium]|nr:cytidylate kinase family protein [Clostridia bacterium]
MIITITGKPCSGKGTVSKLFCQKHNFDLKSVGNMMRQLAKDNGFDNILEFQQKGNIADADKIIDQQVQQIGEQHLDKDILFDSRLAWFFIPKSFKVFIDVDWEIAGERLFNAKRENEKVDSTDHATKVLKQRWQTENKRYQKTYNTDNLDLSNYDFVISSNNKTPEEIADEIYLNYQKFMQKA